jgi:hypothetical protein
VVAVVVTGAVVSEVVVLVLDVDGPAVLEAVILGRLVPDVVCTVVEVVVSSQLVSLVVESGVGFVPVEVGTPLWLV